MQRFHKRRPSKPSPIPVWDIGLVLHTFISLALFEPLETATLEAITYKTFVLIAPPPGRCALRHGQLVRPPQDWFFVLLYLDQSFIPIIA